MNEDMAEFKPLTRLLFIGLWTIADKEGRLENRPKRIKALCLPYDQINIEDSLGELDAAGFIYRYNDLGQDPNGDLGQSYIQVVNWRKHQRPHHKEIESEIPCYQGDTHAQAKHDNLTPNKDGVNPPDTLNLIPLTLNPTNGQNKFDLFWVLYPKKVKKKTSKDIWKRKRLDSKVDEITTDIQIRLVSDIRWKGGFIPDPTTYLNQERWDDEMSEM